MKHIARIQKEFAQRALTKQATTFKDLSYEAQREYLRKHPGSKKRVTKQPGQGGAQLYDFENVQTMPPEDFQRLKEENSPEQKERSDIESLEKPKIEMRENKQGGKLWYEIFVDGNYEFGSTDRASAEQALEDIKKQEA